MVGIHISEKAAFASLSKAFQRAFIMIPPIVLVAILCLWSASSILPFSIIVQLRSSARRLDASHRLNQPSFASPEIRRVSRGMKVQPQAFMLEQPEGEPMPDILPSRGRIRRLIQEEQMKGMSSSTGSLIQDVEKFNEGFTLYKNGVKESPVQTNNDDLGQTNASLAPTELEERKILQESSAELLRLNLVNTSNEDQLGESIEASPDPNVEEVSELVGLLTFLPESRNELQTLSATNEDQDRAVHEVWAHESEILVNSSTPEDKEVSILRDEGDHISEDLLELPSDTIEFSDGITQHEKEGSQGSKKNSGDGGDKVVTWHKDGKLEEPANPSGDGKGEDGQNLNRPTLSIRRHDAGLFHKKQDKSDREESAKDSTDKAHQNPKFLGTRDGNTVAAHQEVGNSEELANFFEYRRNLDGDQPSKEFARVLSDGNKGRDIFNQQEGENAKGSIIFSQDGQGIGEHNSREPEELLNGNYESDAVKEHAEISSERSGNSTESTGEEDRTLEELVEILNQNVKGVENNEDKEEISGILPRVNDDANLNDSDQKGNPARKKDEAEAAVDNLIELDKAAEEAMRVLQTIRITAMPPDVPFVDSDLKWTQQKEKKDWCEKGNVYMYPLPSKFNTDLLQQCEQIIPWFNMCPSIQNYGMGDLIINEMEDEEDKTLVPAGRWYETHQYALEIVFHSRMQRYPCLTSDPEKADFFYIPYYAGFDVLRWHFRENVSNARKDELGLELIRWLDKHEWWRRKGGADHVLVLGKISYDFRRMGDKMKWGSNLLNLPQMQRLTKLLLERLPWHENDVGVPHPTFFHPRSDSDVRIWQKHIHNAERHHLVSFAGLPRPEQPQNIRSLLINQCVNRSNSCQYLACSDNVCMQPKTAISLFLHSHFCLQPPGDSPTRRSIFDSLIAGCIPVFFDPYSAYLQYPWHLPANSSHYSVYISPKDVKDRKVNVVEFLEKLSPVVREEMRMSIIYEIMPGLVYAEPGAKLREVDDAFDVSMRSLIWRMANKDS